VGQFLAGDAFFGTHNRLLYSPRFSKLARAGRAMSADIAVRQQL
jgi:hypothetical protein